MREAGVICSSLGRIAVGVGHVAGPRLQEPFDHPVLDRMKGHNGQLPAGFQGAFGGHQPFGQVRRIRRSPRCAAPERCGWRGGDWPGLARGRQPSTILASCSVVVSGTSPATIALGDPARGAFFAVEIDDIGKLGFVRVIAQIGGRGPRSCDIRISSGPSRMKEKPRSAWSSCIELTAKIEHDAVKIGRRIHRAWKTCLRPVRSGRRSRPPSLRPFQTPAGRGPRR